MPQSNQNSKSIEQDLHWLQTIIANRIHNFFNRDNPNNQKHDIVPAAPDISSIETHYADFIRKYDLTTDERQIVLLALAVEVQPELLDPFLVRHQQYVKTYSEFGGTTTHSYNGCIPTIKTALFVLGGHQVSEQLPYATLFDKNNKLYTARVIGVTGKTGELTKYINIYRTKTGFVHASPGNVPQ